MTEYRKRERGSVIFSPYYKVQFWDTVNLVWKDVQKRFETKEIAKDNFIPQTKNRIMEVTMNGRTIL